MLLEQENQNLGLPVARNERACSPSDPPMHSGNGSTDPTPAKHDKRTPGNIGNDKTDVGIDNSVLGLVWLSCFHRVLDWVPRPLEERAT